MRAGTPAALGLQFALRTRDGRVRTLLVALASGFAIALLLLAVSVPGALAARQIRSGAEEPRLFQPAGSHRLLWGDADVATASGYIDGAFVRDQGSGGPLPSGVRALPAPGTMLVSPALRTALAHDPVLAARLPYRISGTIGDAGLIGPTALRFIAAEPRLTSATPTVGGVLGYGESEVPDPLDPVLALLLVVGVVVLLLPIAVVVVIAGRFGAERRDRRLAALRLAGLSARSTAAVLGVEALIGALAGVAVGTVLFVAARSLVGYVSIASLSVFPSDVVPPAPLAALVVVVVPLTVVGAALAGLRGVAVEPLGVSRRTTRRPRRLLWRAVPLVAGAALLLSTGGSVNRERTGPVLLVAVGVTLLLVAALALLPWAVERIARIAPGGGVAWRSARGRLVHEGGTTVRVVGAVCALTAGAIALQMLFAGLATGYAQYGAPPQSSVRLLGVPAQTAVESAAELSPTAVVRTAATLKGHDGLVDVVVGPCAGLATVAPVPDCGRRVYVTAGDTLARTGRTLSFDGGTRWTLPALVPTGQGFELDGEQETGALLVPSGLLVLRAGDGADIEATADAARFPALVRAATALDPLAGVVVPNPAASTHQFDAVRRGLTIGLVLVLLLVGGVLLVSVVDQLRERRAALAALAALGMRRRSMAASMLWESALPVLVGAAVAVLAGVALGLVLLAVMSGTPALDPLVVVDVALACAVPLLVTAAGLPLAVRLMRPEGLRAE